MQRRYFEYRKNRFDLESYYSDNNADELLPEIDAMQKKEKDVLNMMFEIFEKTTQNIIFGRVSRSGAFIPYEDIHEMARDSSLTMLSYYTTKLDFKVDDSFVGYLLQVIKYPMYNQDKQDKEKFEVSINTPISQKDGQKERTLEDKLSDTAHDAYHFTEDYLIQEADKEYLIRDMKDLMISLFNACTEKKGIYTALRFLILFNFFLDKKSEAFFNKVWDRYPTEERNLFDHYLVLVSDFLKSRIHLAK
jgi:hypothetical protein